MVTLWGHSHAAKRVDRVVDVLGYLPKATHHKPSDGWTIEA
jgi:hypothetical protein